MCNCNTDAPPSFFMDSIINPKVTTTKGKGIGVRSLVHSTSGVKGRVGAPGWGLRRLTNNLITHTNETTNWLVHSWTTFGAWINHEQTRTHKTHHGLDLGEATTFLLVVNSVLGHKTNTQMSFCPGTPTWESRNSQSYPSSRAFQWYVSCHLHTRKLGRFSTFSGRKSNCQFDSRPFFWP
jgi:hypothetical protein